MLWPYLSIPVHQLLLSTLPSIVKPFPFPFPKTDLRKDISAQITELNRGRQFVKLAIAGPLDDPCRTRHVYRSREGGYSPFGRGFRGDSG